jgi:hypothetical protein
MDAMEDLWTTLLPLPSITESPLKILILTPPEMELARATPLPLELPDSLMCPLIHPLR